MTKLSKAITKKPATTPAAAKKSMAPKATAAGHSKQAKLIALLERPVGATMEEMVKVTGWQQHSVRGVLSGVLKKKMGLAVNSASEERGRIYRIAA